MSSLKNLEMAYAVSTHPHITVKKSFFSTKVLYTPTGSRVRVSVYEYTPTEGAYLISLLDTPLDKLPDELRQKGKPTPGSNGHFHLEVCLSEDRRFCALQVFRYGDFRYSAIGEPRFYEGDDARTVAQILQP